MLVILPFHSGDKAQAVTLANWIRELNHAELPVVNDKCLICPADDCGETGVIEPLRDCFGSVLVYRTRVKVQRTEGLMGHTRAANAMWQSVAWRIYFHDRCPWLWLEPDAIPTRPTWLREIEEEYLVAKKPFMGFKTVINRPPPEKDVVMLNGVAVYPASVCDYAPLALQAGDCPWDQNAGEQILKYAHVSYLFQHIYRIDGQAPTFPKDKDKLNNAALFHRCKDGTLITFLKEHGYTPTLSGDVEKPHETRWQAGTDRPEASEQSQPKAQLSGSDVSPRQSSGGSVPPTQTDDEIGEPVDYAEKLEKEQRMNTVAPQKPNEGDRFGELVWRGGKWHTATEIVEAPKVDRASVMEKYKHPSTRIATAEEDTTIDGIQIKAGDSILIKDLPAPALAEPPANVPEQGGGEARESDKRPVPSEAAANTSGCVRLERQSDSRGGQNDLLQSKGRGKQVASIAHQGNLRDQKEPEEPGSPSPDNLSGGGGPSMNEDNMARPPSPSTDAQDGDASPPAQTRHDLIEEAVAVLKLLCTSPHAISKVRKELKKQKVTK